MARRRLRSVKNNTPAALAINGMSDGHLLCRDFGHSWRPWDVEYIPQRRQYVEALVCARCETVRRRLLDGDGALLANSYSYPDGYLVHGIGRMTGDDRNDMRLAGLQVLMRITDERKHATG